IYNVAGLGADEGSRATICAGEQGRYFEMHDTLFFYQALIAYTREDMRKFALALGLDESAFVRCYEADETRLISQMGRAEFDRQQFIATPTLLLDGQVVKRDEVLGLLQAALATP